MLVTYFSPSAFATMFLYLVKDRNHHLKAFADNKINVIKKPKLALGRLKIIVGKGENAGHQHFFFPHNGFKSLLSQGR